MMDEDVARSIARQQWRARIETCTVMLMDVRPGGIARQQWRARIETPKSPVSALRTPVHRPPAMAGAD